MIKFLASMTYYPDLHGDVVRIVNLNDFVITETRYEPREQLLVHSHRSSFFSFVLEGGYVEKFGRQSEECNRGTIIFHPAGETHKDVFYQLPSRCLNLHFHGSEKELLTESGICTTERRKFRSVLLDSLFRKLYRELRNVDEFSRLVLEGIGLEIIGHASRLRKESCFPEWLPRIVEQIRSSFQEKLTLRQLSEEACIHPVHLIRSFRRFYGCTPGDWIRQLRIEYACDQLHRTSMPISQVAIQSGFSDQSAFTKAFKKVTGQTPARFRNRKVGINS